MGPHVNYSGLVIAGIGFFLTRFTVTLAIYEEPLRFYLAGVVPLALGLGLAAFGVALFVADVDPALVRTTARWCVLGTATMLVLIVLTLLGSTASGAGDFTTALSRTYLSNFLIGGSVGGTMTGLYAARNKRHRSELTQQAHRMAVLNRLLRHEVLNAVAVIRGYASLGSDLDSDARTVIEEYSDDIERTIDEVKYLTWSAGSADAPGETIVVRDPLRESVQDIRDRYPNARVSLRVDGSELAIWADKRLGQVFDHLLENAVVHSAADEPDVDVSVAADDRWVTVTVRDDGPGLPETQQALLEHGEIDRFDNPRTGFGLNIVRLLVENYRGSIETAVDETGTTITLNLPRAPTEDLVDPNAGPAVAGVRPAVPTLVVTFGAALAAGVVYGLVAEFLGGSVSFIGVYYGVNNTVVGWITHEFHSVVFGFVFAGILSATPGRYRDNFVVCVAIGALWGVFLWVFAAGVISPVWLRLLAIPAPFPSLTPMLLATHFFWGVSLGALTALGNQHVTPWLTRLEARVVSRFDLA